MPYEHMWHSSWTMYDRWDRSVGGVAGLWLGAGGGGEGGGRRKGVDDGGVGGEGTADIVVCDVWWPVGGGFWCAVCHINCRCV